MKKVLFILAIILLTFSANAQQQLTLKTSFTGTPGATLLSVDSIGFPTGQGGTVSGLQVSADTGAQANPTDGDNSFKWGHWRRPYALDSLTIGLVVLKKKTGASQPALLDEASFGYLNDTTLATADGWLVGYTISGASNAYGNLYKVDNGVLTKQGGSASTFALAVGDTIKFRTMRDSMQVYRNSTFLFGLTYAQYHFPSLASAYPVIRMMTFGASMPAFDKWMIGRHPFTQDAPPPPPATDTQAPTGSIIGVTVSGSLWDTSQTGRFQVTMNDVFCNKDIVVDTMTLGGTFAPFDSLKGINTTSPGNKSITWQTDSVKYRTPKTVLARFLGRDSVGNVGYIDTISITVGVLSQKWRSAYYADYNYGGLNPWEIYYEPLTHIMHIGADWRLTYPYFAPMVAGGDSVKLRGTAFQQDSLIAIAHRKGVKVLLTLAGISDGATRATTINGTDSTLEVFTTQCVNYIDRKGYDGVDIDWESGITANVFDSLITKLRRKLDAKRPGYLISFAALTWALGNNTTYALNQTQRTRIANMVDQINLMTYNQADSPNLGLSGALRPGECYYSGSTWNAWVINGNVGSLQYGPQRAITQGWPASKLGLGVLTYPFIMRNTSGVRPLPCSPKGASFYSEPTYANTRSAMATYRDSIRWDDSAKVYWMSVPNGAWWDFYSWDDSLGYQYKAKFIDTVGGTGIGGIMIWEIGQGSLDAASTITGKNPVLVQIEQAMGSRGSGVVSAPAKPTLASPSNGATGVNRGAVVLRVRTTSTATKYLYQLSGSPVFSTYIVNVSDVADTFYSVPVGTGGTFLGAGSTYYWRVSAGNATGYSQFSDIYSFITTPDSITTSVPTLASPASNATDQATTLTLRWNVSPGATNYSLQLSPVDTYRVPLNYSGIPDTFYQVSGLNNSTNYFWRVQAVVVGGTNSDTSAWRRFTTTFSVSPPSVQATRRENRLMTSQLTRNGGYQSSVALKTYGTLATLASPQMLDTVYTQGNISFGFLAGNPPSLVVRQYDGNFWNLTQGVMPTQANDFTVHSAFSNEGNASLNNVDIAGQTYLNGQTILDGSLTMNTAPSITVIDQAPMTVTSSTMVTNFNANYVGGYSAAQLLGFNGSMSQGLLFKEEFTLDGRAVGVASGSLVQRVLGDNMWNVSGFGGGAGNAVIYGNVSPSLPADSGRMFLVILQPDSATTLGVTGQGGWLHFLNNSARYAMPAKPVGFNFLVGVKTPAAGDSMVIAAGLTTASATNTPFPTNDSTKLGIWFEIGRKSINGMDSVYAVTSDGSTKTKQGILAATTGLWYQLGFTVYADSVAFAVSTQADAMAGTYRKTITTTLPGATTTASPFVGTWNYDYTTTKAVTFDYFQFYKTGIKR